MYSFGNFSAFFLWSPLGNYEKKSCLNKLKFWEASWNQKRSICWKFQLSNSLGTQKGTGAIGAAPLWSSPFFIQKSSPQRLPPNNFDQENYCILYIDRDKIWLSKSISFVKNNIYHPNILCLFTKHNNFTQVCWALVKNLSNFVSLLLKLDNPYCNSQYFHKCWPPCGWKRTSISCPSWS